MLEPLVFAYFADILIIFTALVAHKVIVRAFDFFLFLFSCAGSLGQRILVDFKVLFSHLLRGVNLCILSSFLCLSCLFNSFFGNFGSFDLIRRHFLGSR